MQKTITPGPRAYAALSIIGAVPFVIGLCLGLGVAEWSGAALMIGAGILFTSVTCFLVSRSRVVVSDDRITCFAGLKPVTTARFDEVYWSIVQTLAEPDHPVSIQIERDTGARGPEGEIVTEVIVQIGLKLYRKEDVRWLLSLPELKVIAQ